VLGDAAFFVEGSYVAQRGGMGTGTGTGGGLGSETETGGKGEEGVASAERGRTTGRASTPSSL